MKISLCFSLVVVLFIYLPVISATPYGICGGEQFYAMDEVNTEHDVVFNSARDEFFIVWVEVAEGIDEEYYSLLGQRLTGNGVPIGLPTAYLANSPHEISVPAVAWNSVLDSYVMVFEFDYYGNGTDIELLSMYLTGEAVFVKMDAITGFVGHETRPQVVYNYNQNRFAFVYGYENEEGESHIVIQLWPGNMQAPISDPYLISITGSQKNVQASFNPVYSEYFLVFEETEYFGSNDVAGIVLGSNLQAITSAFIIGKLSLENEEIHEHSPTIGFTGAQGHMFVTWELDLESEGDEVGITDIVGVVISDLGAQITNVYSFKNYNETFYRAYNPHQLYNNATRELMVSYTVEQRLFETEPLSYLVALFVDMDSYAFNQFVSPINVNLDRVPFQAIAALNNKENKILVVHDEYPIVEEKREGSTTQSIISLGLDVDDLLKNKRSVAAVPLTIELPSKVITGGIAQKYEAIPWATGPAGHKANAVRQVGESTMLKGVLLCPTTPTTNTLTASTTSTTTTSSEQTSTQTDSNFQVDDDGDEDDGNGTAIALGILFPVLFLIGLGVLAYYVLVIRKNNSEKAQRLHDDAVELDSKEQALQNS